MKSTPKSHPTKHPRGGGEASAGATDGRGSVVGAGTAMSGRLVTRSDLHFAGRLTGELVVEGVLTVAAGAFIDGPVAAHSVTVAGGICGSVRCEDRVDVARGGAVSGEIVAACIVLGEGSEHDGRIELLYPVLS